jgi:predicted RNA-binding Zn ribbon-like protein
VTPSTQPAPGDLEHVRAFVNTAAREEERLASPEALAAWLAERDLVDDAAATAADLRHARALRGALRDLLGGRPPADAVALRVTARVGPDGRVVLAPDGDGVRAALTRLLVAVHAAQADGTWMRLKVCASDECDEAFFDRSRNRSAQWCSMATCGNRAKVRAFRARSGSAVA